MVVYNCPVCANSDRSVRVPTSSKNVYLVMTQTVPPAAKYWLIPINMYLVVLFQFIDSRLEYLNKGRHPDDLFEEELIKYENTTGAFGLALPNVFLWKLNQQLCLYFTGRGKSCQQLVGNLKVSTSQTPEVALSCLSVRASKISWGFFFWQKGGGTLIHNMKTKANVRAEPPLSGTFQTADCCLYFMALSLSPADQMAYHV